MPTPAPSNLNLQRRLLPGLLALAAAPVLRLLLIPLRKRLPGPSAGGGEAPLLVFSSYMVGDLFMALPALKQLKRRAGSMGMRVICRPDCAGILEREGFAAIPFDNAFFTRRAPAAFFRTLRAAWRLRAFSAWGALDLDADPRTALWLRIAGVPRTLSYRRPFGMLFDETFPLGPGTVHQADRDMAVVEGFLRNQSLKDGRWDTGDGRKERDDHQDDFTAHSQDIKRAQNLRIPTMGNVELTPDSRLPSPVDEELSAQSPPWILSVWTRKAAKNWPLENWSALMERLLEEGVPFAVLHAPDGDGAFQLFRARWAGRAAFIEGSLEAIADRVRASAGAVATDNFLGHMAGYYGKPVLWINRVSPAAQVLPRGPRTLEVRAENPRAVPTVDAVAQAFEHLRK